MTMALCGAASLAELDRDLLRAAVPAWATIPAQAGPDGTPGARSQKVTPQKTSPEEKTTRPKAPAGRSRTRTGHSDR